MKHKPLEGQKAFKFMAEKKRTAKPRLAIVRAEAEDQPTEAKPKPVAKRRLPKAG